MLVKPIHTLLALKALSLAPNLVDSDRSVAAVLIESFNRRTTQCDPGIERIACRHGGMTELEEAELTDGQGRALSAHRTSKPIRATQSVH
jgi:hypothetical protein